MATPSEPVGELPPIHEKDRNAGDDDVIYTLKISDTAPDSIGR